MIKALQSRQSYCLNCRQPRSIDRRGLCKRCYSQASIRSKYPRGMRADSGGRGGNNLIPPIPEDPTDAQPGSNEKMIVMQERIEAGFRPHHPMDYRGES